MGDEEVVLSIPDRRLWAFLFVMVAMSLWAQWLGPGALAELRSEDGSETVLALQLLPFCAAAVAAMWNHAAARLVLYPVSFLPGLALLPDAEWEALATPGSLAMSLATFALYLVVAAGAPSDLPDRSVRRRKAGDEGDKDRNADTFRRFVAVRIAVMVVLFAVVTYALFFAPSTFEALATIDDIEGQQTQHVFSAVLLYFGWVIAVYMGAILPALNWEYHRRRPIMSEGQRQLMDDTGRLQRRVSTWLGVLLIATLAAVWMLGL